MKFIANMAVAAACVGLLMPQVAFAQGTAPNHVKPPVHDMVLGQGGTLRGQVVNAQNKAIAGTAVIVMSKGKKVAETTTDANGQFEVSGLRSGLHAVGSEGGFGVYRTWSAATAPPTAVTGALIVENGTVERGQGPLWYWLTNPWVISLGLAAAIAIPIAVNNNGNNS